MTAAGVDDVRYGVLGVGSLGAAIATGLATGPEALPPIVLSPRSAQRSGALTSTYPSIEVGTC